MPLSTRLPTCYIARTSRPAAHPAQPPLIFPHSFGDAIKWGISRQSLILFQGPLSPRNTVHNFNSLPAPREPLERFLYFDGLLLHFNSILFEFTFVATYSTTRTFKRIKPRDKMGAIGQLLPLVLLFAFVGVLAYVGYQVRLLLLQNSLTVAKCQARHRINADARTAS